MNRAERSWNDHPVLPYVRLCYRFRRTSFYQGPRRLLDYLVLFLEKGRYLLNVGGVEYELKEGDFALIQPGDLLATRGFGECVVPNAHLDFFYNPARERSFVTSPGMTSLDGLAGLLQPRLNDFPSVRIPVKFQPADPAKFQDTLYRMIERFKRNDIQSALAVQELALCLLRQLLGEAGQEAPSSPGFAERQFVSKMDALLSSQLSAELSVSDMARHAGYSESHFASLFAQAFGTTPHRYLLELRLRRAKEMLADGGLKIGEIAQYCGFSGAAAFSKAFKKKEGRSPVEYRRERYGKDR